MREADVLIVGAGPAGATTALNLAPFRQVVMVERRAEITPRIGESLVPAARRLLRDMGLLVLLRDREALAGRSVLAAAAPFRFVKKIYVFPASAHARRRSFFTNQV